MRTIFIAFILAFLLFDLCVSKPADSSKLLKKTKKNSSSKALSKKQTASKALSKKESSKSKKEDVKKSESKIKLLEL